MNHLRRSVGLFLFIGAAIPLAAQNSEVSGRVLDSSKAAIAGAQVTLTRSDSGTKREAVSSAEGYYTFPLLVPGVYDISVTKEGFEKAVRTAIAVSTGEISTVDLTLAVGSVSQTVDVSAVVPLLQSESAAVNGVVENETITNMPLLDRRSSQCSASAVSWCRMARGLPPPLRWPVAAGTMPII